MLYFCLKMNTNWHEQYLISKNMHNIDLKIVYAQLCFHSSVSDYYIPSWPWETGLEDGKAGLKKVDKQSDQKQPLR